MFDQEKLVAVIAAYKDYFPNHWKDEKYKWEAIQYFKNIGTYLPRISLICLWKQQIKPIICWLI